MKKLKLSFFVLFLFETCVLFSQTIDQKSSTSFDVENINSLSSEIRFLSSTNFQVPFDNNIQNNSVFVNQIGDKNVTYTNVTSNNSLIELTQNGNRNNIYLQLTAETINEKVYQRGNDNSFLDFSNFGNEFHGVEAYQSGNGQNLTFFGGNSISENLKITMQGESQTIIVRNFN